MMITEQSPSGRFARIHDEHLPPDREDSAAAARSDRSFYDCGFSFSGNAPNYGDGFRQSEAVFRAQRRCAFRLSNRPCG